MNADQNKLLVYFEDETHLVRRLGAAVVSCWKDLPDNIRDQIVKNAILVIDDEDEQDIDAQIRRFIADHDRHK